MPRETMTARIHKLVEELYRTEKQLLELREKLIEAQERNRKLDWLLTEATERLERLS